jgi:hypothetical protein
MLDSNKSWQASPPRHQVGEARLDLQTTSLCPLHQHPQPLYALMLCAATEMNLIQFVP